MTWNWQRPDWPNFRWSEPRLAEAERLLIHSGGVLLGSVSHLGEDDHNELTIEAISTEALTTSEIEGEILDRDSVQSSIKRQLGLPSDNRRIGPAERGIAEMMVDLYRKIAEPLSQEMLFNWHAKLLSGRSDIRDLGRYRTDAEAMQIVSGRIGEPTVHFEAPPAERVPGEMARFIDWFNCTGNGREQLPAITRAGIAHVYFESIHPFEDGNGRIGRAIAEKSLAQSLAQPTIIALSATMLHRKKEYYKALEGINRSNEIADWLAWFAGAALEANNRTLALVQFLIDKTRLLDKVRGRLNERQERALMRMLREGPQGFEGGLSAKNYVAITGASASTTTRDLADLTAKGGLRRTGEQKGARYHLPFPIRIVKRITLDPGGRVIEG